MRVLFDTSVLVAGLVEHHPEHPAALRWLQRSRQGDVEMLASAHTLAELFAVLTVLPSEPRIGAEAAARMIGHNVDGEIVPLEAEDYRLVVARLAAARHRGGIIYDALIARCAEKAGADLLLTLNPRHFRRVWPEGEDRITSP